MKASATNPLRRKFDQDPKQRALRMIEKGQRVCSVTESGRR
jgi:hypothetical protein